MIWLIMASLLAIVLVVLAIREIWRFWGPAVWIGESKQPKDYSEK